MLTVTPEAAGNSLIHLAFFNQIEKHLTTMRSVFFAALNELRFHVSWKFIKLMQCIGCNTEHENIEKFEEMQPLRVLFPKE